MALPPNSPLILRRCTMEEAKELGGSLAKKEKVDYDNGPNIQWYIWGENEGHAALIKMGHAHSSHWRIGRCWLTEEARGKDARGFFYTGVLIRHGIQSIWDYNTIATISMIPWEGIAKKHQSNGWQFKRDFKGPFVELQKVFTYFTDRSKIYEYVDYDFVKCTRIIYPGDLEVEYEVIDLP